MELPKPPQQGHSRAPLNETSRKLVTSPRRITVGPLDLGEVPSTSLGPPLTQSPSLEQSTANVTPPPTAPRPNTGAAVTSAPPASTPSPRSVLPIRGFPNLLQPHIFHPLPNHDLPAPFRQPTTSIVSPSPSNVPLTIASSIPHPTPDTPLAELLSNGYFRAAAITAATMLPKLSPSNHTEIFKLWYIRLSCLCLIGATQIACVEVKALEDLSAPIYWQEFPPTNNSPQKPTRRHLVPWELRLLAIRLQALSFNDWRRALVFYYELAREARAELARAINSPPPNNQLIHLWKARLQDLGIRVASALVEMGDLAAAARHLESLRKVDEGARKGEGGGLEQQDVKVRYMLCLLYIRIGNFAAAKDALPPPSVPAEAQNNQNISPTSTSSATTTCSPAKPVYPTYTDNIIYALLPTATGSWESSILAWSQLPSLSIVTTTTTPTTSDSRHTTTKITTVPDSDDPLGALVPKEEQQYNVLERQNLAVSLVYTGRLSQARDILEDLIEEGNAFYALTFNLCTIWELVTDGQATRDKKAEVAEKVALGGERREAGPAWFKM